MCSMIERSLGSGNAQCQAGGRGLLTYAVLELPLVYGAGRKVQAEALFRKVCAGLELHRGQTFQRQDPKSPLPLGREAGREAYVWRRDGMFREYPVG